MTKNADLLLDVRTTQEFAAGHLEGAVNIPHDQVQARISEIEEYKNKAVVLYCKVGGRAAMALEVLKKNGFQNLHNAGGFEELSKK